MEFNDLIKSRESVRSYDPERIVPQDMLHRILEAGRLAPSACNIQPYRFLVVSTPGVLEKVKTCYKRPWFQDAPHIIVIVGHREKAWKRSYDGYNSIETDMAIAMTHIVLAAANEGVATCWIEAYDPELLRSALSLKPEEVVFGITPLGFARNPVSGAKSKQRKPFNEIVEFL